MDIGWAIVDGLIGAITYLPKKFLEISSMAWGWFSETFGLQKVTDLGKSIVMGVVDGLGNLKDMMVEKASAAWGAVKGFFGFSSPATEGKELGKSLEDGMMQGMDGLADAMVGVANDALAVIAEFFSAENISRYINSGGIIDALAMPFIDGVQMIIKTFDILSDLMPDLVTEGFDTEFMIIYLSEIQKFVWTASRYYRKIVGHVDDVHTYLGSGIFDTILEGLGLGADPHAGVQGITGMMDGVEEFTTGFAALGKSIGKAKTYLGKGVSKTIQDIVEEVNKINDLASQIQNVSVDTALDKISKTIATGGDTRRVKIAPGMFEMNVTINVKMDKHTMVKFLSNKDSAKKTDNLQITNIT